MLGMVTFLRFPFRIFSFNLDGGVKYFIPPAHVGGFPESPFNIGGNDVGTETRLSTGETPDMEVEDSDYPGDLLEFVLEVEPVGVGGGTFHQHGQTVASDGDGGAHDDAGEDQGADGVEVLQVGITPDHHCGDHYSHRLHNVSQHMDHSCSHVIVFS